MAGRQREYIEIIDLPYAPSTVTGTECIPLSYAEDIQIINHFFCLISSSPTLVFTVYFVPYSLLTVILHCFIFTDFGRITSELHGCDLLGMKPIIDN